MSHIYASLLPNIEPDNPVAMPCHEQMHWMYTCTVELGINDKMQECFRSLLPMSLLVNLTYIAISWYCNNIICSVMHASADHFCPTSILPGSYVFVIISYIHSAMDWVHYTQEPYCMEWLKLMYAMTACCETALHECQSKLL